MMQKCATVFKSMQSHAKVNKISIKYYAKKFKNLQIYAINCKCMQQKDKEEEKPKVQQGTKKLPIT